MIKISLYLVQSLNYQNNIRLARLTCTTAQPTAMQYSNITLPRAFQAFHPPFLYAIAQVQSHLQLNLSRHAVLLSHKKSKKMRSIGKGEAFQRAFWAWGRLCRPQGTVPNRSRTLAGRQGGAWGLGYCKCRNSISGIYNITRPNNACIARNAPPVPPPAHTKKKNSSSANTWVLVNKYPAPCYSPTVKFAVPSPLRSLTTVFGKGTCVTTSLWAPEKNQIKKIISIKSI